MAIAVDFQTPAHSLFTWQAYEPAVKCDLSSCAIETNAGLIFIDPIELAEPALTRLLIGRESAAIILTNGNHTRAAEVFRRLLQVKVFAAPDSDGLDLVPDGILTEGEMAPGDLRVISIPGAGPGETALVGHDIACLGDALIHLPPEGLRFLPDKYCANPAQNRASLRKLLSCDFQVMTFAHGAPLVESAHAKLEALFA